MFFADGWHARLREERERLGHSQPIFGGFGGVKKQTQIAYEQGKSSPDIEYLQAIEKVGADVFYVLTGARMQPQTPAPAPPPPTEEYSQQEKVIVAKLRMLDPEERDEIEELVEKVEQAKTARDKVVRRFRKAS
ncbi:helix-turn-helix domain-containing protein [Methylomagnum ishizawai]|uniref:helix-turn-helix domain-containing protein n=1 Tax=Methylomagnum ishizawai TaxID=1760988 RepID=UPI001C326C13|nr:helix-turn-helix transcriptional regulator [Methylomagnum ishizawai]BBL73996.1 transcriptional regulator [Methylomagnum ishizawai]